MRMSSAKRNAIARLRRAIRPLLYPTGIVDDTQPDGRMKLYLFQHGPGGNLDFYRNPHPFAEPGNGVVRSIPDRYRDGSEILNYHGFADGAIVDDVCIGITLHPFSALSLATLRGMERLVAKIKTYEKDEEAGTWRRKRPATASRCRSS